MILQIPSLIWKSRIRSLYFIGIDQIRQWTKRSLSRKPFCLIADKDWTNRPRKVELREIYTKLIFVSKHRKSSGVEEKLWDDTPELFQHIGLGEDDPVRILMQGIY